MRRYKLIGLIVFFILLLVCDWHISNIPLLKMRTEIMIAEENLFLSLFDSINGYTGILQLLVIYTLVVLLSVSFFAGTEKPALIVRYEQRSRCRRAEIYQAAMVIIPFAVIHEAINWIFTHIHFGEEVIQKFSFPGYTLLTIGILILFYLQVEFVYFIISDLSKKKTLALMITFFIYLAQYWVCKFQLFSLWMPYEDLLSMFNFLLGSTGSGEMVLVLARMSLLDSVLFYLCQQTFEKKDLLKNV